MKANELSIGQQISAEVWFRCGLYGDDKDNACIQGEIIDRMECYNSILIKVDLKKSANAPQKYMWIDLDKVINLKLKQ